MNEYKTCSCCGKMQPIEEFHRRKHRREGRCKTCLNARYRQWRRDNPERAAAREKRQREKSAEYRRQYAERYELLKTPAQKAARRAYVKSYYWRNLSRMGAQLVCYFVARDDVLFGVRQVAFCRKRATKIECRSPSRHHAFIGRQLEFEL